MEGSRSLRFLARVLVVALVLCQPVVAHAGALAGILAVTFLAHGHRHPLSLLPDGGHLDVVLHHEGEGDGVSGLQPAGSGTHDGDHVVHVDKGETGHQRSQGAPPLAAALALGRVGGMAAPGAARAPDALAGLGRSTSVRLRCGVLRL